jgi:hypothetical protein
LKVSILVEQNELKSNPEVFIRATGNLYYKIRDTISLESSTNSDEDTKRKYKRDLWKRIDFINEYKLNVFSDSELEVDFSTAQEKANKDPLIAKKIPDNLWNAKISVSLSEFSSDNILVSFNYENTSKEPKQLDDPSKEIENFDDASKEIEKFANFERTLFNCRLDVDVGNLIVKEFIDDYIYEEHKQRYFYDFRTVNCQARWLDDNRKRFTTDHFAQFEQQNIRPRESIPGLNLAFSNLMSANNAILSLDGFINEMKKYGQSYKNNIPTNVSESEFQPRQDNRQKTWGERIELAEHFEKLIARIEKGLDLIKIDPKVRESFLKTNETFYNYYKNQDTPLHNAGWRLFQLAFFLSSIESLVEELDLDIADVLHVDTGGGKSEAYFALVVFTSFYERSTGKEDGVSSIVKFPLRMLSIQQLERAAGVIIHAEAIRKKYENSFLGSPFSLGYYVGNKNGDFPDLYAKVKNGLYEKKKLISPAPSSKII